MPITRRHLLRIFFYGSFGLVILIGLAHPFSRQLVFGPKIGDLPLCFWQDNFRIYADPYGYVDHDSPASKLFRCLGIRPKIGRCDLPNNKAEMLAVLLSLVDDPRPHVRACLARELIRGISPDDSVPPLLQLLDDHDASVRAAAAWSLWRIEPGPVAALPRLLELLEDPDEGCRVWAAFAVWRIGGKRHHEIWPVLRAALCNPDETEPAPLTCAIGINMADSPAEALPLLEERARDVKARVRQQTADALRHFGKPAVRTLVVLLRDTDPDYGIRGTAASCLGIIGPDAEEALPNLVALVNDPDRYVRESALDALHSIDPERFADSKTEPD